MVTRQLLVLLPQPLLMAALSLCFGTLSPFASCPHVKLPLDGDVLLCTGTFVQM